MSRKIITALMVIFNAATIYSQGVFVNNQNGERSYYPADIVKSINVSLDEERAALLALYNATDGANWNYNENWCSDKPISEWYGVTVRNGQVTELFLSFNNLVGEIPPEIGNLTALTYLNLQINQLSGSIPTEIWELTELTDLWLSYNQLTGSIPSEIGNLTELTSLSLEGNQLTGSIPSEIGKLTELNYLWLDVNQLTGSIPSEIGKLTALKILNLRYNQLTGSIPSEIGNLTELTNLDLDDNQLTGSIPTEIGKLTKLNYLNLSYNQLTGSIPDEIFTLTGLEDLELEWNNLTGSISEEIGNLLKINRLSLYNNDLSGNLPKSLINLFDAEHLKLGNNNFSGKIPESYEGHKRWAKHWAYILLGNYNIDYGDGVTFPSCEFTEQDINGETVTSDIYSKNRLTMVMFWASWCPSSKAFIPKIKNLYDKCHKDGFEVLAVSIGNTKPTDTEEAVQAYIKENDIPWINLFIKYYTNSIGPFAGGFPTVWMVDAEGRIVFETEAQHGYNEAPAFIEEYFITKGDYKVYTSSDFSKDGEVFTIQKATVGQGIDLVFMGDGFVDTDMEAGGAYEQKMAEAVENFFAYEPYKSFRDRFNAYGVKVVSNNASWMTDEMDHRINGSNEVAFEYAQKAVGSGDNPMRVIVVYNTDYTEDRSYTTMYYDGSFVGYIMKYGDAELLTHEVCGHGFGQLLDEYVESGYESEAPTEEQKAKYDEQWTKYGMGANVDWRTDLAQVRWAKFIDDERYANEGLGAYEGAATWGKEMYRPTENSMMRYNNMPFNAPSREQIYKNIMKWSEGSDWTYDYEKFVEYDAINRTISGASVAPRKSTREYERDMRRQHKAPIIIRGTWRNAK